MEPWEYILLAVVGILCGVINVIAGGGSLLTLPVMILMGIPESVANGTNRVAILAQSVSSVATFRNRGFANFKTSMTLSLCTIPGGIAGAWCGAMIRGDLFNHILAGVMIGVVILMAFTKKAPKMPKGIRPQTRKRLIIGHLCMIGIGFYGGFIQAGVGFLMMAVLNQVMRLDLIQVNMHKVFIVGAFTIVALVVFMMTGNVWWIPGIALAIGNAIGGWLGTHLTISKGEVFVRRFFYAALIVMAIKLLF